MDDRQPPAKKEIARIDEAVLRWTDRRPPVQVEVASKDSGFGIEAPHSDGRGHSLRLADAFGSRSTDFVSSQLGALEWGSRNRGQGRSVENGAGGINASLAIVEAIRPENELEAALAVQMAQNHMLTTELLGRAKTTDRTDHMQMYGNLAVKLQRTFTAQIEVLARMRGKGQQTVRVEHVTVEAGAQAIVGDVHHHPREMDRKEQSQGNSHAQSAEQPAAGPIPALPSPDPLGDGVQVARHDERPVSNARRHQPRRTKGQPKRAQARTLHP